MKTEKVWDPSVRLFHWSLAALVVAAFLTAEDETIGWHVRGGIAIAGLLVYRVSWGFLGPEPARFRAFVQGPRAVLEYLRGYLRGKPAVHRSHNPLGAWMVVTLLAVLAATAVTGGLTYASAEWDGPLAAFIGEKLGHALEEVHEGLANSLYVLIPAHVLGVIVSSVLERQNLVKGMITGQKRVADQAAPPAPARLSRFLLAAAAGAAVAAGLVALLKPAEARADVPAATSLLRSFEHEARGTDPAFAGFSAEDGRSLYLEEFPSGGKRIACASCHGADPRQKGRTPAGKNLKPLSPAANAQAFSDPKRARKKFDRYCKEVLGRLCSTQEKGDLLTWLIAP